jgi:hypothetical protein
MTPTSAIFSAASSRMHGIHSTMERVSATLFIEGFA